jgi:flagellar biosynthesis/type III secretory pathway protein FliH
MKYIVSLPILLGLSLTCQAKEIQQAEQPTITWQQVDAIMDDLVYEHVACIHEEGKEAFMENSKDCQKQLAQMIEAIKANKTSSQEEFAEKDRTRFAFDENMCVAYQTYVSIFLNLGTDMSYKQGLEAFRQIENHLNTHAPHSPKAVYIAAICTMLEHIIDETAKLQDLQTVLKTYFEYVLSVYDQKINA